MNTLAQPPPETLLTYQQAANILSLSLRHFRRELIDSGKIPFIEVAPRSPRVDPAELNAYLASKKKCHGAQAA